MNSRQLHLLSAGYLLLPNLVFFYYWFNTIVACIAIPLLLLVYTYQVRTLPIGQSIRRKDVSIVAAFALFITLISGVSGLCHQTFDYWAHNTKHYDLFVHDWPLKMPERGPNVSYYFGYYVVPGLVSKITHQLSESAIFIWTYLGFFLGLFWIYLILNRKIVLVLLALTIGDTAHVLKTFFAKFSVHFYDYQDFGVEIWSNFENLLWVPNQSIPSFIMAGMLVFALKYRQDVEDSFFAIVLSFWWAVFPALTMSLLMVIIVIRNFILSHYRRNWYTFILKLVVPALIVLPPLFYFSSHQQVPISGFIWTFREDHVNTFKEFATNIGLNLFLFFLARRYLSQYSQILPDYLFNTILVLILFFSLYRMGKVNDFLFRGPMPYLIIIGSYLFEPLSILTKPIRIVKEVPGKSQFITICLLLVFSSCFIAIGRIIRAVRVNQLTAYYFPKNVTFTPVPYNAYPNTYLVLKERWTLREANQYLGKSDSIYEQYLASKK